MKKILCLLLFFPIVAFAQLIVSDTFNNGDRRDPEFYRSGSTNNFWNSNNGYSEDGSGNLAIVIPAGGNTNQNFYSRDISDFNFFGHPLKLEVRDLSITGTGFTAGQMGSRWRIMPTGTVGYGDTPDGIYLVVSGDGAVTGEFEVNSTSASWGTVTFFSDTTTYGDNEVTGFDLTLDGTSGTEVVWSLTVYGTSEVSDSGTLAIAHSDWNGGDGTTRIGIWTQPSGNDGTKSQTTSIGEFNVHEVVASSGGNEVVSFELINADTDLMIQELQEGDTLDLSALATTNLNVRAIVASEEGETQRVEFDLTGATTDARVENVAPYAMAGDSAGNYGVFNFNVGSHTLTAVPYTEDAPGGTAGTQLAINFTVVDSSGSVPNGAFVEANGLVVFEVESSDPVAPWVEESTVSGYFGDGYFRGTDDFFNDPGQGTVSYPVYITSSGRYQLNWRSRILPETSYTEQNDSFARLTDENGNPVTPVANDLHETSSWYKVYLNNYGWIWDASNKDGDARSLAWDLAADTLYYFEISMRSEDHAIDRIALWDQTRHDLANEATGKQSDNTAFDALPLSERQTSSQPTEKPRVWVVNDLRVGDPGDEDDDVCMGVLLLLADQYTIEGISVNANPAHIEGTETWARDTFVADYLSEVDRLNAYYGDRYQTSVPLYTASTSGMLYTDFDGITLDADYLDDLPAMKALIEAADAGPLYILNWGPLTEVAMAIKFCIDNNKTDTLRNIIIISHWTQRGGPWNCGNDNGACNYVHDQAEANPDIVMYELGPVGQEGLVENFSGSTATLDSDIMFASAIGAHLSAKWLVPTCYSPNCIGMPDMSDGSTMLVLMGFGGGTDVYNKDGSVPDDQNLVNFLLCDDRPQIFAMLEERARVASGDLVRPGGLVYEATQDFANTDSGAVPYYHDSSQSALAINASIVAYRDQFAKATRAFDGPSGIYDVLITSLRELDGESSYRLTVDGLVIGEKQNVTTTNDYMPNAHLFSGVSISNGMEFCVESNSVSNGKVPEGGGFAYARGRWTKIEFIPAGDGYTGNEIVRFDLIDADTDSLIQVLGEGDVLDLNALPSGNLNVRAIVASEEGDTQRVEFDLAGATASTRVENAAPYALAGDDGAGDYSPFTFNVGLHTLTATPYTGDAPAGSAGTPHTINFSVIDPNSGQAAVSGELKKWHKVSVTFDGPMSNETATPNPFTDYRLDVTFTGPGGQTYVVPGFYAADGNAANTGADSGNKWRVHFAPDEVGEWSYSVSFLTGTNAAVDGIGTPTHFHGASGTFTIAVSDKTGRDFRGKGRLRYVGEHYLQFSDSGGYFLKQGPDAPENFLAYTDFDGPFKTDGNYNTGTFGSETESIKTWSAHSGDWNVGDPTWGQVDGTPGTYGESIIGAVNYLASEGLNAFSFLTFNIAGDDKNVFMYTNYGERERIDISRMGQWEVLFEHADKLGMFLHFKTQETENDLLLDGGELGHQRKLYYRELIARFSHHLALNWNLGEENDIWQADELDDSTQARVKSYAQYFHDNDPYQHHVVIHTYPGGKDAVYGPLLGNASEMTGASLQTSRVDFGNVHDHVRTWVQNSASAGKLWAVACDEPGDAQFAIRPDNNTGNSHEDGRKNALWGTFLAGGWGNEWYFGYSLAHSDLTLQDFRSRDRWWDYCRYSLEFFELVGVPYWEMANDNTLTNADYCFYKGGEAYIVFDKSGGSANLDLPGHSGEFDVRWYDPRNGGGLQIGSVSSISGGSNDVSLGTAPDSASEDWVIVVTPAPTTSYGIWSTGPWLNGLLADSSPSLDFDGGGLETGIEWVVGGDPTFAVDDAVLAPTVSEEGNYFVYSYRRTAAAANDPNTRDEVQYSSGMSGAWMVAVDDGTNIDFLESLNGYGSGIDKVEVKFLKSHFGDRMFVRLAVEVTGP